MKPSGHKGPRAQGAKGTRGQGHKGPRYNTTTTIITTPTTGFWWHGGSGKVVSSNQITAHSGTGEKETQNINVVGKNEDIKKCVFLLALYAFK